MRSWFQQSFGRASVSKLLFKTAIIKSRFLLGSHSRLYMPQSDRSSNFEHELSSYNVGLKEKRIETIIKGKTKPEELIHWPKPSPNQSQIQDHYKST